MKILVAVVTVPRRRPQGKGIPRYGVKGSPMLRRISRQMLVANLALLILLTISFVWLTFTDVTAEPATYAVMGLAAATIAASSLLIFAFLHTGWEP